MSDTALADHGSSAGLYVREDTPGHAKIDLIVEGMHCAGCMQKIERGLGAVDGVISARANLSTKRVAVSWEQDKADADRIIGKLQEIGFESTPFDAQLVGAIDETESSRLLRALGVAGFAAANVMLLSVSVWSGLVTDMEPETRALFHWLSAMIALPAVAFAGRPFFTSAWSALKSRSMNMDVPISLAVLLACTMSVVQTLQNAEHVYFDASISLLFFLLIGRYLDVQTRAKACSVAQNLLALRAIAANLVEPDGRIRAVPVSQLEPGMIVSVAAGQRLPADGEIIDGASDIDTGLVTGESVPVPANTGTLVFAGTLNLTGPLKVRVTARDDASLLSEIVRLMESAEQGRAGYVRLADRIARAYAPVVHILAAATVLGWLAVGADWQYAVMTAIAVLIITCPCALGLAVPVVQVVASGRLLKQGVLVKSPDALERLADIDAVYFDKTGTLTLGALTLENGEDISATHLSIAAALARASKHPLAQAVFHAAADASIPEASDISETPGAGLSGDVNGESWRLGNRVWTGVDDQAPQAIGPELWLSGPGTEIQFRFSDQLRADGARTIAALQRAGFETAILSGDNEGAVETVARQIGISNWQAKLSPADKISVLEKAALEGRKVLMVGDGLNDAPALKTAYVSMSPASASDISQTAADFVFQGGSLGPVLEALTTAQKSRRLVFQNFTLAIGYNLLAVPLAVAGFVTPLVAAIAMSTSSIIVTLNALRLGVMRKGEN